VPAMLIAHMFGASVVEAIITGLGVAYLQKRHPDLLQSMRSVFAGEDVAEGVASRRPLWQVITATVVGAAVALGAIGLIVGGGDPNRFFGADWSAVSWPDVIAMLAFVTLLAVILVPLAYLVLPERYKRVGAAFTLVSIIAPLGLIAPGFAYGEGSAEDVRAAFGYVPQGLQDLSGIFSAPLSGYDIPFVQGETLVRAAIGYELTGLIGILLCGMVVAGIGTFLSRNDRQSPTVEPQST
jgi:cobalt/nickel transport system permease protein